MKDYVVSLLNKGARMDGRNLLEYRTPIKVELNVSKNAEGSAKVTMGETEVLAGVKLNVGEPFPDTPNEGVLIVGAELLPLSSPEFESGPPGFEATELARIIDRGIRESNMLNIEKLVIKEGELVWMVFLDIYTINDAGNLIDASALAAIAALKHTVFPKLEKDKVAFGEHTKEKLPLKKVPITCTIYKIADKIIIDPNEKEQKVIDSRLTVAVSENNKINALQKGGNKGLSIEDIYSMIEIAQEKTKELRKILGDKQDK
ncbi:exosome complex protein Rrp42 [Candidatus Woesearchaeota archaeon]|nr:exosome complex protein Rrp42 [Candidatus Woesearchaeota archaeon]